MTTKTCMYTIYSDSHQEMFERFFLPSVPDSFELTARKFEQDCPTGEYYSEGWTKAVSRKIDVILDAVEHVRHSDGPDYFVFADCDIRFFTDIHDEIARLMEAYDFVAMDDDIFCAGFFAIRADDRAVLMWQWIRENIDRFGGDQKTCNAFLRKNQQSHKIARWLPRFLQPPSLQRHTRNEPIRCGLLPRFRFFNYMHLGTQNPVWDGTTPYTITDKQLDSMQLLHANFTLGIENKIKLLDEIGELKLKRNQSVRHDSPSPAQSGL